MSRPRAMVLAAPGTNRDHDVAFALQLAGADPHITLLEELLAAGAPVAAHWIADRQSGTLLLRFGREEVRRRYLPAMACGELFCCFWQTGTT